MMFHRSNGNQTAGVAIRMGVELRLATVIETELEKQESPL